MKTEAEKYYDAHKFNDSWGVEVVYPDAVTKMLEISRIEGLILGLQLAKKAWDKGFGREDIYENELHYKEELNSLLADEDQPTAN